MGGGANAVGCRSVDVAADAAPVICSSVVSTASASATAVTAAAVFIALPLPLLGAFASLLGAGLALVFVTPCGFAPFAFSLAAVGGFPAFPLATRPLRVPSTIFERDRLEMYNWRRGL